MTAWILQHKAAVAFGIGGSVLLMTAGGAAMKFMLLRLPPDYFAQRRRPPLRWKGHGGAVLAGKVAKNLAGYALTLAGVVMLVTPGPGLIAILLGVLLVDFPGKYRVERWALSHGRLLNMLNRFRTRHGREPLQA